jgi:uncharacterized membrane protein YhaH (DUF805 family)
MICESCNKEIDDDAKFCVHCGKKHNLTIVQNKDLNEIEVQKIAKFNIFNFYFSPLGSIGVKDFLFKGFLPLYSILVFLLIFMGKGEYSNFSENFIFICILLNLYCLFSISVKRLRDMNKNPIWAIIIVILSLKITLPILYLILLIPANKFKFIRIGFIFLYLIVIPLFIIVLSEIIYKLSINYG